MKCDLHLVMNFRTINHTTLVDVYSSDNMLTSPHAYDIIDDN
jgi:hypothetical protein